MELQILHAGISHPSPYFHNFCRVLKESDPKLNLSLHPSIPSHSPCDEGILHFHRLKRFYDSKSQESAESFIESLRVAKRNGWKVAWTIHNFFPIDREISDVDIWTTHKISEMVDIIFTHTELMKNNAEKLFSKRVINSFCGVSKLDGVFDENKVIGPRRNYEVVFTFAGNLAGYKCIPEGIASFKRLKKEFNGRKLGLIIAGPSSGGIDLEEHIKGDSDISFYNFFIGDSAWKDLNRTTSIFLGTYNLSLPAFKYGFFPSTVPQVLSYKKAMILPDCPEIREFVPREDMAIFYDHHDKEGLLKAMRETIDSPKRRLIERNLEEINPNNSWNRVVEVVLEGYRKILGHDCDDRRVVKNV